MKITLKKIAPLLVLIVFILFGFSTKTESTQYKCMIQMTNYSGEGACIIISLLNPNGKYEKTLRVLGDDEKWYHDIHEWWNFHEQKQANIDAITGATIAGGERSINVIEIEPSKIDTGYKLRFETAVEDQEYYKNDIEFELTSQMLQRKVEGHGFIRYIRIMPKK
ncbi:MAG: DUF2271 domain-containing protein [Flavobacteriaceae bacterium]|nr:DUF2271 domain-containing protein [Flavobacteriaceae bacterium]